MARKVDRKKLLVLIRVNNFLTGANGTKIRSIEKYEILDDFAFMNCLNFCIDYVKSFSPKIRVMIGKSDIR